MEQDARRVDFTWAASMVAGVALVFLFLSQVRGVAVPVVFSLAIAYALNPAVTYLEKKGIKRTLGTVLVFAAGVMLLFGFVMYLIPVATEQADKLPEFFKQASTQLFPWVETQFGISVPELIRERTAEVGHEAANLATQVGPAAAKMVASFAGTTASVVAAVMGLLFVPVLTFFFLADYPQIVDRMRGLLPRRSLALVSKRFAQVDEVLSAFLQGQVTVGAILAVIYSTGFSIARIDMAIVIGLLTGIGNMVPYLGTGIGVVASLAALALSWQGPWQLVVIAGTFVVAQVLEGLVITPRIVGERVGLPPVVIIIAVLAFAELFGFLGVLLAVPATAVLKVALNAVIFRYRRTTQYAG
ncbi:MAG: AI-2E family transporter [Myxococcaceae bacterium]|nr:AI-2E family transporter [Myxococcaceae bacterium]